MEHLFQTVVKVPEAKEPFFKSLEIPPKNAETQFNLANSFRAEENFENSLLHYLATIFHKPTLARGLNDLALVKLH